MKLSLQSGEGYTRAGALGYGDGCGFYFAIELLQAVLETGIGNFSLASVGLNGMSASLYT
ncbi:hypothetical protein [Candidatus Nitrotoga sp. BS]|uniref:hypothetical protein n=1 Tax=Candidatus Nitrotoga sp. BS TaxID=2890408 RepID=UPI001EF39F5D|nr:hypothetical protein [Candidatus Nitrotoga sp. BS]